MKRPTKYLCALAILAMTASLRSCAGMFSGGFSDIVNQDLKTGHVRTYVDGGNTITLKLDSASRFYSDEPTISLSYKVDIQHAVSVSSAYVYLRLLDNNGFQLSEISLGPVVANFTGTLKGQFSVRQCVYEGTVNAEIFLCVNP